MLAALTLAITLATPLRLEVAYIARYYHPPTSRKVSKYHVYLSDLDGTQRLQISQEPVSQRDKVFWKDRDTLIWGPEGGLWTSFNLRTKRRLRLTKFPTGLHDAWVAVWPENHPLRLGKEAPIECKDQQDGRVALTRSKTQVFLNRYNEAEDAFPVWFIQSSGSPALAYAAGVNCSANGMEEEWGLFAIDWKAGKTRLIRRGIKDIQVYPSRDLGLAAQMDRNLIPYGKEKDVWGGKLYAFNLRKSRIWTIVKGQVNAMCPRLRP